MPREIRPPLSPEQIRRRAIIGKAIMASTLLYVVGGIVVLTTMVMMMMGIVEGDIFVKIIFWVVAVLLVLAVILGVVMVREGIIPIPE